jgi:hypothetical protein
VQLSPVVGYRGLGHRYLPPHRLLMRPPLNGGTLGGDVETTEPTYPYDDDFMSCRETYSTLRVFSDAIPPAEISAALKLEPTSSHLKGEAISPRVNRPRREHGWLLSSEHHVRSRDTRRHIDWILDQLEPCSIAFESLLSRGASVDIFSYWTSASGQGGPILSPPQFARLARFRLECIYDIYFTPEDDD